MDSRMMTELLGEFIGTMILVLLGDGVVAGNVLKKTKSEGTGWLLITFGWGLAVTIAVFASGYLSPAHLNPAVTLGMAIAGETPWSAVVPYILSQIAGGIAGRCSGSGCRRYARHRLSGRLCSAAAPDL